MSLLQIEEDSANEGNCHYTTDDATCDGRRV
jgi:hypothetical protein